MRSDTATGMLREQHRLILRVVDAFGAVTQDAAVFPSVDRIEAFITFFRLFTDACHHGKEEDVLFTALEEHGLGGAGGPLDAMRAEHRFGRTLVRSMTESMPGLRAGEAGARAALRANATAYIDFIRAHIAREDEGLFDLADNRIDGPACARLCDAYENVCQRRFEGLSVGALERLAADLIEGVPARHG